MNSFLLDTNVVSELRKKDRADVHLRRWFQEQAAAEFWLSVLVIGELRRGIALLARRDLPAAGELTRWLVSTIKDYADRILPINLAVSERWAVISVPDPVPIIDGLLAATAIEHDLTLVTRYTADVQRTGVALVNPFEPK